MNKLGCYCRTSSFLIAACDWTSGWWHRYRWMLTGNVSESKSENWGRAANQQASVGHKPLHSAETSRCCASVPSNIHPESISKSLRIGVNQLIRGGPKSKPLSRIIVKSC